MPVQARAQLPAVAWAEAREKAQVPGSAVLQRWITDRPGGVERAGIQASDARYLLTDREAMAEIFQIPSHAGPPVSPTSAMRVSTFYACVTLICGAVASLPFNFFERTGDADGRKRIKHDLWWLFNEQPTPLMPASVYWEYILATRFLHGDGFAWMIRNRGGAITEILPLSPLEVDVRRQGNQLFYVVDSPELGKPFGVFQDDMLHFPGFGFNLRTGRSLSIVRHIARQAIGTALATDEFSARFFSQGAQPSHVIRFPGPVKEDQIDALRKRWEERQAGLANSHKPLVLTNNADVKELSLKPQDAQLLETKRFTVEDICRPFGVPPFMVGATDKVTSFGSGVEHMGQGFIRFTLARHINPLEQEINRKCFRTAKYFGEFNVDGLQRGDLKARGDYYRQAIGGSQGPGWMKPNEIRDLENLEPVDGGDKLFQPAVGLAKQGDGGNQPPDGGTAAAGMAAVASSVTALAAAVAAKEGARPVHVSAPITVQVPPTPVNVHVPPSNPTPVNVQAPEVHVAAPRVAVHNHVEPTPVTIRNDVAVAVDEVKITAMPARESESTTERNSKGEITKVKQTEKDA